MTGIHPCAVGAQRGGRAARAHGYRRHRAESWHSSLRCAMVSEVLPPECRQWVLDRKMNTRYCGRFCTKDASRMLATSPRYAQRRPRTAALQAEGDVGGRATMIVDSGGVSFAKPGGEPVFTSQTRIHGQVLVPAPEQAIHSTLTHIRYITKRTADCTSPACPRSPTR